MQFSVDLTAERFLARLAGADGRLDAAMVRVITRQSIEMQAAVKDKKLSGQVLHNRTGTLRRSINRLVVEEPGRVYAQIGTNVVYAGAHEYGFNGVVNVRAHVRRVLESRQTLSKNGKQILRKKRGVVGETTVRAHPRHMVVQERSYLRSTLREAWPAIKAELKSAAIEALK